MTIWKDIEGYEGYYQVSACGKIRSLDRLVFRKGNKKPHLLRGKERATLSNNRGYYVVVLYRDATAKVHLVHCLVAAAFIGPRPEGMQCCHNDGNKANNCLGNLRYDTPSGNACDRITHGTQRRKLSPEDVEKIKSLVAQEPRSMAKVARLYDVSREAIRQIISGKTWSHLTSPEVKNGLIIHG